MIFSDEIKKLNWLFAKRQIENNDDLPDEDYQKYLNDIKQIQLKFTDIIKENGLKKDAAEQIYSDFNADIFLLMQEVARGKMSNDAGKSAFDKINRKYDNRIINTITLTLEE